MGGPIEYLLEEFQRPLQNPILVFSTILSVILLAPILLRKIRIPGIIGLIISGVIIGPNGLNILEKNSAVELLSTIGLLYIMFIAGLELDLQGFRTNRNRSFVFGLFTFALPIAIGYPVCRYYLGYDFNASFLTASMFATHTLVAYPIVSKLGVSKNQAVAVTVGGTILTDTAVLIILAVIMGNHSGELTREFWLRLGISLVMLLVVMFWVVPRLARWFFEKLENERHAHYIFVLAVVFFSAFLAEAAGVEAIIGAFLAGLALNPLIPHSSALMNRIEFMGNALFIPFFLISVGMLVDVQVIFNGTGALVVAGVLSVVALFGKWLAAWFTQVIFGYSSAQRKLIFGLSSAHAAATLAVIIVGFQAGILDERILNGTIVLILITCLVASFATEKAARKLLLLEEGAIPKISQDPERILLPVANLENTGKVLEFAVLIKDRLSPNPLTLLSVVPNDEAASANLHKAQRKLDSLSAHGIAADVKVNTMAVVDYNVASGITRASREIQANIIILGWPEKPGLVEKIIGDKVGSVVKKVDKTIFICQFIRSQVGTKKIVVIAPEHAEQEAGFELWVEKLCRIGQELSAAVVCYCSSHAQQSINAILKEKKLTATVFYNPFKEWEDFLVLGREIEKTDLVVVVSGRLTSPSYVPIMEAIPGKLEKYFPDNNKMIIFPKCPSVSGISSYDDFSASHLSKGVETIEQLGKGISDIFRKEKHADDDQENTPPPTKI